VAVAAAFGLLLAVSAWLVLNPPATAAPVGDAIFVHAGGRGERVQAAVELFEAGVAPVLVVSDPGVRSAFVPRGLCDVPAVVCVMPEPINTAGEAQALGGLVDSNGWDRVVVVTSDYHMRRAMVLDSSCTTASIEPVPAASRRGRRLLSPANIEETLGLAFSWLIQRC